MDRPQFASFNTMSAHVLALLCFLLAACSDSGTNANTNSNSNTEQSGQHGSSNKARRVVVIDQGMNMPVGAFTVPAGWSVDYDIVTNPYTAKYDRFLIDIRGPNSMLIHGLGFETYSHYVNQSFNAVVEMMVLSGLRGIDGLSFGQFSENTTLSQTQRFQARKQAANAQNMDMAALQLPFSGNIGGNNLAGSVEVVHTLFYAQGRHSGGAVQVKLVLSPENQLTELIAISHAIDQTFESYPEYDPARARIIDAVTARQSAEHRQRMAAQEAQFNAHQQMMQTRYQSAYQQNQQWLENFRNDGVSTQDGYSQHNRFLDTINEVTRFNDANSGGQVTADGYHDRWATDDRGNYIGSDSANFNPDAMGGSWREAAPLR